MRILEFERHHHIHENLVSNKPEEVIYINLANNCQVRMISAFLFVCVRRCKFSCSSCKAARQSSALKVECEGKTRPPGSLDSGAFSEVGGQNGFRMERQPRGELRETRPKAGPSLSATAEISYPGANQLLESTKSSQEKAAR